MGTMDGGIMKFITLRCEDKEELWGKMESIPELSQGYSIVSIRAVVVVHKAGVSTEEAERALREQDDAHAQLL